MKKLTNFSYLRMKKLTKRGWVWHILTNFRVEELLSSEIMHSDWIKLGR